jgi:hypothetical protein
MGTAYGGSWDGITCGESVISNGEFAPLMCNAEDNVRRGKYFEAEKKIERALSLPLYEQANFEALLDLARTRCHAKKKVAANMALKEFDYARAIAGGQVKCSRKSNRFQNPQQQSAHVRMCTGFFDGYEWSLEKDALDVLDQRRQHVTAICSKL